MKIVNKHNKKNWDSKIEWVDKHKYLKLSENDKKKLLRFRSLHSYINKMNKSIEIRTATINELAKEINDREKKIKHYENEGKGLYQFLEKLKSS